MSTKNKKICDWFEQGKITEALIGEKDFFIPDVTYHNHHDRLLVFRQLFLWYDLNKASNLTESIEKALCELSLNGNIYSAFDMVWCYLLISAECNKNIVDTTLIEKKLIELVNKNVKYISNDIETRELILSLAEKLPYFKKELNL